MKKFWSIGICCLLLVGCGGKASSGDVENANIVVGGSTSIQPLMEQIAESYNKEHSGKITVQGGGSSVGTKGTIDGTFTIGMASRDLKSDEASKLDGTVIALDGIELAVNKHNKVKNIKLEDVKKIFTGEITNWKEVGGDDLEIAVISREDGSGTRDGFESVVGFESNELIPSAEIQNATGAIISNVAGNKNAIGYISMGSHSAEIKTLKVDGVKASEKTVTDKTYKLQRPFVLCVKTGSKAAEPLYDYIFSEKGKEIIRAHFYVPVERAK